MELKVFFLVAPEIEEDKNGYFCTCDYQLDQFYFTPDVSTGPVARVM